MKNSELSCVVYCNTDSKENAQLISKNLVESKKAACVSIIGPVESVFEWENKIHFRQEYTMMIKTKFSKFTELEKTILELHPDQVPEIIALPIQEIHGPYHKWINEIID